MNENYKIRNSDQLFKEKVIGDGIIRFLYGSGFAKPLLWLVVAHSFVSCIYGKIMDTKWSKRMIVKFIKENEIDMSEAVKSPLEFSSFNDFFIRELKPESRPIDAGLVSPADGKILVFENINSEFQFYIKNSVFDIHNLINDRDIVVKYDNSSMAIIRLAPVDYHRFHFPTDGYAGATRLINGKYYSVSPIALRIKPNILWENKRTITEIKNELIGEYLFLEIGATMVGSIKQTYIADSIVQKGDEKGYFEFGGSTVVLIFQKGKIKFDEDLLQNTRDGYETKIKMGERIGCFNHEG